MPTCKTIAAPATLSWGSGAQLTTARRCHHLRPRGCGQPRCAGAGDSPDNHARGEGVLLPSRDLLHVRTTTVV